MTRYAIYAAPERDTRHFHFGNRVLGRDPETGEAVDQIVPEGFARDEWQAITAAPRLYGFHATLKAPFALAEGKGEEELFAAVAGLASQRIAITGLKPAPVRQDTYVALQLAEKNERLESLAADCVRDLDGFRAPLTDQQRARRQPASLSERQRGHLEAFGYPYIFEDFTFHLTLAGPLAEEKTQPVLDALKAAYAEGVKEEELAIRALCVFKQPEPGAPFRLVLRAPLETGH